MYVCFIYLHYRYNNVCDSANDRRSKLDEANTLHQFFRDIDDEEAWIKYVHFIANLRKIVNL